MAVKRLKEYLDDHNIHYQSMTHIPAYTAQEVAASAHVSGKQMAKTVIIKLGDQLAMVVVPAHDHINFAALKAASGSLTVTLATEIEFKNKFPECELGAMPPFGNLYEMPVFVSSSLTTMDQIIFNAGSHSELIKLAYQDFERLVKPKILALH